MSVGPGHAGSPPSPEPDLPGEFVSEDLRNDCARFLDELRRLVGLRRELTPEKAAWPPARVRDPACPDLLAESPDGAAAQVPPNSHSKQAGQ
jgi:hypothetical protein